MEELKDDLDGGARVQTYATNGRFESDVTSEGDFILDWAAYDSADDARAGHLALVVKWRLALGTGPHSASDVEGDIELRNWIGEVKVFTWFTNLKLMDAPCGFTEVDADGIGRTERTKHLTRMEAIAHHEQTVESYQVISSLIGLDEPVG